MCEAGLLDVDAHGLDDVALGKHIAALELLIRRASAAQAAAVRAFEVRDAADAYGSPSAKAWLCEHTGASEAEARALVGLGRALDRLPSLAAAFAEGAVTAGHVRVAAAATQLLDAGTVAEGEAFLALTARRLDSRRFGIVARRWLATVAPAAFERDTEKRYDSRWLSVRETFAGMRSIQGMLDPESGLLVERAIDALVSENSPDDTRTTDQQRADALVDLVTGDRTWRPEIVVHAPVAAVAGDPEAPPAELADTGPVTAAAFDRLACDARWRRLLVDGLRVPVELGRASRDVPAALRKFVALRDGHCRYPGCTRGPAYCDVHHVVYWRRGGPTDAGDLALLCRYHHHLVHERRHEMALLPDGTVTVTRPDGHILSGRARGPTEVALV